ncbi:MAG: permease-like cell division protein FtsX [Bacillota bacterium]|nr:permease-like cell division protein FtsX [Bacillota bacterium]
MRLRVAIYIIQEAFRSLRRNGWLNFAAAGTTAVSLFVLGISILLVVNTNYISKTVESNVEIMVYLEEGLKEEGARALRTQIVQIPGVKETRYISREEALASLERQFGKGSRLRESLGGTNPLPDAYKVRTDEPRRVIAVANAINQLAGVEKVRYGQEVVEKLFQLTAWVRRVSIAIMGLLGLCAIFLIATTIRLTMYARRREISIMKYVGATDWFVRWPFLLEGVILGGAGALTAIGILYFSYGTLVSKIQAALTFLPLVKEGSLLLQLFEGLLTAGIGLGLIGSYISVHRYLRV